MQNSTLIKIDRKIIRLISKDTPLAKRPFKALADNLNIREDALLSRIKAYKNNGFMRKYCAVLHHIKAGFKYNAMVVWNISKGSIDAAGNFISSLPEVSHCYQREKASDWNYNLYCMIHGKAQKKCLSVVKKISKETGCKDYKILFSSKEYKKTNVSY